jgi:pyruvate dehydrogenase E1 component alpha subunit
LLVVLGLFETDWADDEVVKVDTPDVLSDVDWDEFGNPTLMGDGDDRIAVVLVGDGGCQNGRLPELLNTCSKLKLPLLIIAIDNGRAINTFTKDVAANTMSYKLGNHYQVPGVLLDGLDAVNVVKAGMVVTDFIRKGRGSALIQIHTYRFMG